MTKTFVRSQRGISANELRQETLDGRPHAVVPAAIIVEGVLNGALFTRDEMEASVEGWNGRPIPLRHPRGASGEYVGANDPAVIEQVVIGQFFKAEMRGDRIVGEMWLDVGKIERLGGEALTALRRLEAGEVLEVSTGLWAEFTEQSGDWNGVAFQEIAKGIVPDHVALLPDEVGACSVADGCGAGRAGIVGNALDFSDGIMVAFYLAEGDAGDLAINADAWPEGSEPIPPEQMHVTLAYLGTIDDTEAEFNRVASVLADVADSATVIMAEVGGMGRFTGKNGLDAVFLHLDGDGIHLFRDWVAELLSWETDVSRLYSFIPHVTLGYVPGASPVTLAPVERRNLIFSQLTLSWGEQSVSFDLRGQIRASELATHCSCGGEQMSDEKARAAVKVAGGTTNGKTATKAAAHDEATQAETQVTPPEVENDQEKQEATAATGALLPPSLLELAEAIEGMGGVGKVLDAIKGLQANADAERARLIARLAANARNTFTEAELGKFDTAILIKMDRALAPVDFRGQAGGALAVNADDDEWRDYVKPKAA